jgi:Neutral/alkaline non-lysosomal ceramidase, N-terminal
MAQGKGTLILLLALFVLTVMFSCGSESEDSNSDPANDDDDDVVDDDDDAAPEQPFRAGFARAEITPEMQVNMAGYGSFFIFEWALRKSEGVHDPIYASAAAFEDVDGDGVVMIVLDNVGTITNEVVEIQAGIAAATGLEPESVVVSSTHNHHGPDTIGLWGLLIPPRSGRDEEYIDWMVAQTITAGTQAWENRVPATLEIAAGQESTFHFNQNVNDPERALDSTMTLLAAYDETDELLGTLMNWPCHPTVREYRNRLISADYPGAYYAAMEEALGGTHLFVNGAIAATQPYNPDTGGLFEGGTWDDVEMIGNHLAETAIDLAANTSPVTDDDIWLLDSRELHATVGNILFRWAAVFEIIPREIPPLTQEGISYLTTFAIGPVMFGTVPGEYIPDYSFQLRQLMGGDAQFIIGLGMDWIGYAITPEQYSDPAYIYEWLLCPSRWAGEELMEVYREIYADL